MQKLRYFKQSWQLLFGLNPNILFGNLGSNIASTIFFTANCTILSSKFAIASPLTFPLGFGIFTFLAGFGLYDFVLSLSTMLFRFSYKLLEYISFVTLSRPVALLPSSSLKHSISNSKLIKW